MQSSRPNRDKAFRILLSLQLLLLVLYPVLAPSQANASLTAYIRLDRLSTSEQLSGTACMQPSDATDNESQVKLTFPSSFTVSGTAANWSITTTNLPSGTTAWPGIAAPSQDASISGQTVTFIGNGLASGSTTYCFNFDGSSSSTTGSTTGNTTGSFFTVTSTGTTIDSVDYAQDIVSSGNDQIVVNASVPPTFTFTLGATTANLGTLSTLVPNNATVSATFSTNAYNGWIAWVKSANAALSSSTSGGSIASNGTYPTITSLASTSGYVLDVEPGTGSPTVDAGYDGNGADSGGHLDTQFRQVASNNAPASGDQISLEVRARAGATTKAASDYTDTLTVTAAGSF